MDHRVASLFRSLSPGIENLVVLSLTGSTHAMARRLIVEMGEEERALGPTVIVAHRQDAGEGRGNNSWREPRHGLFLNWLRSGFDRKILNVLPVLAAASARLAVASLGVAGTAIKWPNDLLVEGRKIAGLLTFARHGENLWVTVGLGVNLDSAPTIDPEGSLRATAVSDHTDNGDYEDWRREIVVAFVHNLHRLIATPRIGLDDWRAHLLQKRGDEIRVRFAAGETVVGTLTEVTAEGFLRIQTEGGERLVTGGDLVES